jgi:MSHA biogenesis protein MshJ
MKAWWKLQAAKINALSLRERAFLFVACMGVLLALVETLWLEPANVQQKAAALRVRQQEADLQVMRTSLQTIVLTPDSESNQGARAELAELRQHLNAVNARIAQVPLSDSSAALQQVLVQFLKRHEGLTLVRTATLIPEGPGAAPTAAAKPASAPGTGPQPSLSHTGLELTVAGAYLDLMRYVETLERELPGLRWGAMKLKTDAAQPQLTLQVSLVGVKS